MALLGYDGASAFDLNVAKQHGGIVIADYLVGHPGGYDPANEARVDNTRFLGMGAYPNWERAAGFFNTCTVAEARAAGVEGAAATKALGFPADGSIRIAFSFDQYVTGARFVEMGQKFAAVRAGVGAGFQAAVYGQYGLINYLVTTGHAPGKHWLSGSTYNEPYNPSGPNIAMVQSHDAQGNWINTQVPGTDVNTVIDPHALGAWWPTGSPYAGGTDVDITPAQMDAIAAKVRTAIQPDLQRFAQWLDGSTNSVFNATTLPQWGPGARVNSLDAAALDAIAAAVVAAIGTGTGGAVTKADVVDIINATTLHANPTGGTP